jgi:drug/metabolite transporter (DMT)-like permease
VFVVVCKKQSPLVLVHFLISLLAFSPFVFHAAIYCARTSMGVLYLLCMYVVSSTMYICMYICMYYMMQTLN